MTDIDPRRSVIGRRLARVKRIVAVTGGKGGIGKSTTASVLALVAADAGLSTGLLDLDLTGPTDHILLGAPLGFPKEEFGIEPAVHAGIRFLSVAHFVGETPAPLRGEDITNVILELLAIVRWQALDLLLIDMPPGLGDTALDLLRLVPQAEFLSVATPSRVVVETVRRHVQFLQEQRAPIVGLLENMSDGDGSAVRALADQFRLPLVGTVPRDPALERATGDPALLRATRVARELSCVVTKLAPGIA